MERNFRTNFRLLVFRILAATLTLAILPAGTTAAAENLYVRVGSDNCGRTLLALSLENVNPLPAKALLRIKTINGASVDGDLVVEQTVELEDGKYHWAGLLRYAEYNAQLLDVRNKKTVLGDYNFTNEIIARKFIRDERSVLIQVRGGGDAQGGTPQSDPERSSHEVNDIKVPPGVEQIHIILINSKGELADQYLGKPVETWRSKLIPVGDYRQILIGYGGDWCRPLRTR